MNSKVNLSYMDVRSKFTKERSGKDVYKKNQNVVKCIFYSLQLIRCISIKFHNEHSP